MRLNMVSELKSMSLEHTKTNIILTKRNKIVAERNNKKSEEINLAFYH